VIVELLDIEREARAAGQYAPAVRAVEVAAKIGGLFVERSVSVSVTDLGQAHVAALLERMQARRALPPAPAGALDAASMSTGSAVVTPPTITVTLTETRAGAFDGFDQKRDTDESEA
jgi:hypothetical protein